MPDQTPILAATVFNTLWSEHLQHGECRADCPHIAELRCTADAVVANLLDLRDRVDELEAECSNLTKRYTRTLATLRRVLRSRRHWQDRTIALTDALDCGCYEDEIYVPLRMATVWLPGDAPAEVSTDA